MSYAAFLRFDELVHIRAVDVKFNEEFMSISIPKSKTDQLHKGDEVVVAKMSSKLCPVSILQKYMTYAGIQAEDTRFIFRPIIKTKHGEKLRESGSLLTQDSVSALKESLSHWASQLSLMGCIV